MFFPLWFNEDLKAIAYFFNSICLFFVICVLDSQLAHTDTVNLLKVMERLSKDEISFNLKRQNSP